MRTQGVNDFFHIIAANHRKGQVICVTCKLKRCIGKCKWEVVASPKSPKAV
jgi:hypothetical protein